MAPKKGRARLRPLIELVREARPDVDAPEAIRQGLVVVNGRIVTNPASAARGDASIRIREHAGEPLRGEVKLAAALRMFGVAVEGRIALDLGAAAGGFTRALLRGGASRVYAVDAGHGQLLGSLRQHPAVVNIERTNLAELNRTLVPEPIDLVTADLSYVALARAIPQLEDSVTLAPDGELIALVKPQFELGLPEPPRRQRQLGEAVERALAGAEQAGWSAVAVQESPVRGGRGTVEFFLHARRRAA